MNECGRKIPESIHSRTTGLPIIGFTRDPLSRRSATPRAAKQDMGRPRLEVVATGALAFPLLALGGRSREAPL
jgi:hypothetical protein